MTEATPETTQFLKEHRLCVFATGRKDGSPQQSYIGYQFDGRQFLLGGQATSAKMRNLRRNPGCSLIVPAGSGFLLVYGTAEVVEEEAEMAKLQERFGPRGGGGRPANAPPRPAPTGKRINVLVTPAKFFADRIAG